jgi:hypothetical protein
MEYFRTKVTYRLTALGQDNFGLDSIYASLFATTSVLTRAVNWSQVSLADLALLLINLRLASSPSLLFNMSGGLGTTIPKLPRVVVRAISQFLPLHRENESYYFDSNLDTLDQVHIYLDVVIEEINVCLGGAGYSGKYGLPQFSDPNIWRRQMQYVLTVLRRYRSCSAASQLGSEIAVSLSNLSQFMNLPMSDTDISRMGDFASVKSDTTPYGVRRYIPLGNKVAFWGEPSNVTLCLSRLFVSRINAVYESGESVLVNIPPMGYNVVIVDDRSQGQWLLSLLQGANTATNIIGKPGGETEPESERRVISANPKLVKSSFDVNKLGKRMLTSLAHSPGSRGEILYVYDGTTFREVGKL